jgi:hypothetical protein
VPSASGWRLVVAHSTGCATPRCEYAGRMKSRGPVIVLGNTVDLVARAAARVKENRDDGKGSNR